MATRRELNIFLSTGDEQNVASYKTRDTRSDKSETR